MAAINVVEGRPLQADKELLLRDYNADRISQEFASCGAAASNKASGHGRQPSA